MSGLIKYRVHEVAKDFGMTSKEITQILTDYATTPKNHMQVLEDAFEITTDPNEFSAVREKLEGAGLEFLSAEVQMIPQNTVAPSPENIEKIQELLEMLEDNDDVQNVWHNAELPEEPEED